MNIDVRQFGNLQDRKAVFVCTHPVWNVPPFLNVPAEFAAAGSRVWVIGYQAQNLPRFERVSCRHLIMRLPLVTRSVQLPILGKALALMEFLVAVRRMVQRINPHTLIAFNDPATLILRMVRGHSARKIAWLLEYPEFEKNNFAERALAKYSAGIWGKSDMLIVPTPQRLALHLGLRPECVNRPCHVVHNTPRMDAVRVVATSPASSRACAVLRAAKSNGCLTVVYAGAVGNRYAVDELILAAAKWPNKVHLLVLGKKHELAEAEVSNALKSAGQPGNFSWIDEVLYAELAAVLFEADVGFATYLGDSLNTYFSAPGKIYDYLKSGLIILSDDSCCIRDELMAHGAGILLSRPVTSEGIASVLSKLLELKPEQLAHLKESALRLFANRFCLTSQLAPVFDIHSR